MWRGFWPWNLSGCGSLSSGEQLPSPLPRYSVGSLCARVARVLREDMFPSVPSGVSAGLGTAYRHMLAAASSAELWGLRDRPLPSRATQGGQVRAAAGHRR